MIGSKWKIFTDTPIDVWAQARAEREATRKARPPKPSNDKNAPADALASGKSEISTIMESQPEYKKMFLIKVSADCITPQELFPHVATALGGQVVKIIHAKYADVPLAVWIVAPPSETLTSMLEAEFEVGLGATLTATSLRAPSA
jgi:hypothetical protein